MGQLGHNKRRARQSQESDGNESIKMGKNFTPGRIRATRMGVNSSGVDQLNEGKRNNYIVSPNAATTSEGMIANKAAGRKQRAHTKPAHANANYSNVDQSDDTLNKSKKDLDYMLPAVKVKPKRKKRSPSSNSPRGSRASPELRNGPHNQSTSNHGFSGHKNDPKLRDTLNQSLHFIPTSIKVPVKQTHFYDDKHHSAITEQQMKAWRIKNGSVILDEFNTTNKNIPKNRHRIPKVGDEKIQIGSASLGRVRKISPENTPFDWDMDGRRHKKSKKKPERVVTTNASLQKVDLPRINKETTPNRVGKSGSKL